MGARKYTPAQKVRVRVRRTPWRASSHLQAWAVKRERFLAQSVSITHSPRAAPVLHKGQAVSGAYLVVGGRLRVFTIPANGNEATLYFVDPGEACVLALNCLFSDLLYPAWVQAEMPTDTRR